MTLKPFEDYRKRLLLYKKQSGPLPVSGEEIRRVVSGHARHQTQAYPEIPRAFFRMLWRLEVHDTAFRVLCVHVFFWGLAAWLAGHLGAATSLRT